MTTPELIAMIVGAVSWIVWCVVGIPYCLMRGEYEKHGLNPDGKPLERDRP